MIRHCSPTLAGLKTGSLFSCPCRGWEQLTPAIRSLNHKLVPRGLRVLPLRLRGGRALVYVYRPNALEHDLRDRQARSILEQAGYLPERSEQCLLQLIRRLREEAEFPHEIGLFLSYPPEDVRGFMENKACRHKCVGCWKVYGDEEAARRTFARYEHCTRVYQALWAQGRPIEGLTVAG